MHTPADIAQLAAELLGGAWAAEHGPREGTSRLTAPETDTFTLHFDDHGHLYLGTAVGDTFGIARSSGPPASDVETIARDVVKAIRQQLAAGDSEQGTSLYQELNLGAHFSCADYSDPETPCLPSVTIAGATCFFCIDEAGILQVSVHRDRVTAIGTRVWGEETVPMQITAEDGVLFSSVGTWVVEFQHPDDGGDDGVWQYAIPAEEAPTEAMARVVATERFVTDINSRENADAWDGSTIRSVRFGAHPR